MQHCGEFIDNLEGFKERETLIDKKRKKGKDICSVAADKPGSTSSFILAFIRVHQRFHVSPWQFDPGQIDSDKRTPFAAMARYAYEGGSFAIGQSIRCVLGSLSEQGRRLKEMSVGLLAADRPLLARRNLYELPFLPSSMLSRVV